jgi:hypothetical protein
MNDPRLRAWSCPGLGGRRRWPSATNCSVHQPLARGADQGAIGPLCVLDPEFGTIGVAEIELGQIAVQMGFTYVEVAPVNATLQDREEPLQ